MPNNDIVGIILAGGKGKRMGLEVPKPLIELSGKPIIYYSLELLKNLGITNQIVATPKQYHNHFLETIKKFDHNIQCIDIDNVQQKGNGAGLSLVLQNMAKEINDIIVIHPDSSCFIKTQTILDALNQHRENRLIASFSVKEGGLNQARKAKNNYEFEPLTASVFIFNKNWIIDALKSLKIDTITDEFRLEYVFEQAIKEPSDKILIFPIPEEEYMNINTPDDLIIANKRIKKIEI